MSADVDIDLADRDSLIRLLRVVPARQETEAGVRKHNSGVYATDIPVDPFLDCASIDYKTAEERGYFKIDLLNQTVYNLVRDPEHYEQMLAQEPDWSKLVDPEFVKQVVHIGNYGDLIKDMEVNTIPRMAMFLALIRPSKKHLVGKSWKEIAETIWDKPENDEYYFKKAHAVSYAHLVALHINLLCEQE